MFYNACAVVTGGSSGIGLEIAARLAGKGAHLLLIARDGKRLEQARQRLLAERLSPHQRIRVRVLDITRQGDIGEVPGAVRELGGADILVNSAGLMGIFGYSSYCASKYAVTGLSECLRLELKPRGIHVSLVCPPRVMSPMDEREAAIIPPETRAMKNMVDTLSPGQVAEDVIRGMEKKRFLIIPGRLMRMQYMVQRWFGGPVTRAITDWIVRQGQQ